MTDTAREKQSLKQQIAANTATSIEINYPEANEANIINTGRLAGTC